MADQVVLLRSFGYRHEGEFARGALESAGIRAALMADDASGMEMGLSFSNPARLLVRREDLEEARRVLEEMGMM